MRAADPAAKLAELLSRPLVKVCGLTREEDVAAAAEAGADMVGFVLARGARVGRPSVLPVPETVLSVAVVVGDPEGRADLVQLYPRGGARCAAATPCSSATARRSRKVVDLPWQEDDPTHLDRARAVEGRVMLAGGLGPENVRAAIDAVRRGRSTRARASRCRPGIKDHERVRAYVEAAR